MDNYRVALSMFEGPFDLLLFLIRKNEVDIYDIPIALITEKYLKYLEWMKAMNIDVAGEFLVLASTLTQIKSKMLLPAHENEDEDEDPRLELIRPLEEYLRIKSAAEKLAQRDLLGEDTFLRNPFQEDCLRNPEEAVIDVGLFELIDAFQKILENISPVARIEINADTITVRDRIVQIVDIFETRGAVTFNELFSKYADKSEVIVTFLAILEMVKLSLIRVVQHTRTGIIRLFYL